MLLADGSPEGTPAWVVWMVVTFVSIAVATPFAILWRAEKFRHRASINDLELRNKQELEALERRRIADVQEQSRRTSDDDREQKRREQGDEIERARIIFQNSQVKELITLLKDQLKTSREEVQQLKDQLQKLLSKS